MASRTPSESPRRPAPRLYLAVPSAAEPDRLAAALGTADVAAVLLSLPQADERSLLNRIKALTPVVQDKGAALLLEGHAGLVARAGADGAHLWGLETFQAALATLKPARIAGCGALATRHDAMVAAEAGADYVMFGEPDANRGRPSFEAIRERVAWWAELFEIPCVGYAAEFGEIAPLVQAGADFVAVGDFVFADPRGPAAATAAAARELGLPETAA
jgi:thiamine-phosphate pyrophosphorylase